MNIIKISNRQEGRVLGREEWKQEFATVYIVLIFELCQYFTFTGKMKLKIKKFVKGQKWGL